MDVFITNVPPNTTNSQFKKFLRDVLGTGIDLFDCRKDRYKQFATVTFLHVRDAQAFLQMYGGWPPDPQRGNCLRYLSAFLCCKPSNRPLDRFTLRSLEMQEKKNREKKSREQVPVQPALGPRKIFDCHKVACGTWDYGLTKSAVFTSHVEWTLEWKVRFGKQGLIISEKGHCIQVSYANIEGVNLERGAQASITLTLQTPPLMSERKDDLVSLLESLSIFGRDGKRGQIKPVRVSFISPEHKEVASTCFVYRLSFQESLSHAQILELLRDRDVSFHHPKIEISPKGSYAQAFRSFLKSLAEPPYLDLPFGVKFQAQKLVNNGYLPPDFVRRLLPEIAWIVKRSGGEVAVMAVRNLFDHHQIPYAGPATDASDLSHAKIVMLLKENEKQVLRNHQSNGHLEKNSDTESMIYKASVTPAMVYLSGPEPEVNNRVLRKYSDHLEDFLRVEFTDEDGSRVRFNPKMDNEKIFNARFGHVLQQGIEIAGKRFSFLGFSHSSLRAQMCWFMSPFVQNKTLMFHAMVIAELGDFSRIRSPAKCAARIGQAFSDTPDFVTLGPSDVLVDEDFRDVEANGRVFSDGCGTCSMQFLEYVRKSLPKYDSSTCFQIRFRGAKGMVSLDTRLQGNCVRIRPSMIKFPTDGRDRNFEICGSAKKPLGMYLNRQLIKILEDCGVAPSWFINLQRKAVRELEAIPLNVASAAQFLLSRHTGESFHLSWFIKKLHGLGMPFQEDVFLKDMMEMFIIVELRALKHRSRILVEKGFTLYGIMDETGILEEGEVFVITSSKSEEGKKEVLVRDRVIVSRSPALHPGDVQLVRAVDVPHNHPLRQLSNCICFSQKGHRDLPSQLSGGDLDGDFYHIIFDPAANVQNTYPPADYPRTTPVDIGRSVVRQDMIDFFVTFMATDQLGRIANLHQILADQEDKGTLSASCLKLADMHSTAVDYSKTGVPVDLSKLPKANRCRPDFMAPGPHVIIKSRGEISLNSPPEDAEGENDEEEDLIEYHYYESHKVLGVLYRDIDEKKVFHDFQRKAVDAHARGKRRNFIGELWSHIQAHCSGVAYDQHMRWAHTVREWYEDAVLSIMDEHAPSYRHPLSEPEVFIGQIVGKTTAQSKRNRDLSMNIKERFDRAVAETVRYIIDPDEERLAADDALERAMACLAIAVGTPGQKTARGDVLVSFRYIAASVCLREVEKAFGPLK